MKFVSLRSNENVADKCWGNHGKGVKYYDTAGAGYVSFSISEGSCTTEGQLVVMYYESKYDTTPEPISEGHPAYDEFYAKLMSISGGSYAQPFKGESSFPDTPSGMS